MTYKLRYEKRGIVIDYKRHIMLFEAICDKIQFIVPTVKKQRSIYGRKTENEMS